MFLEHRRVFQHQGNKLMANLEKGKTRFQELNAADAVPT